MDITMNIDRLLHLVEGSPTGNPLLMDLSGRSFNEMEVVRHIKKMAGGLAQLKLAPQTSVAILALNCIEGLEMMLATIVSGNVAVPLNLRWTPPELVVAINDADAQVLVVDDTFAAAVEPIMAATDTIKHVVYIGANDTPKGAVALADFLAEPLALNLTRNPDTDCFICYTGGTTGSPKGVVHTHKSIMSGVEVLALTNSPTKDKVFLGCFPYFHIAGYLPAFARFLQQSPSLIVPMFRPDMIINAVKNFTVDELGLAPTMIQMLLSDEQFKAEDFNKVSGILYGSSPIAEGLLNQLKHDLPHVKLVQGYGMSEVGIPCFLKPNFHHGELARIAGAGQVTTPISQVKIEDEEGNELPTGETGEIVFYGPTIMKRYHNKPEQTAQTLRNGGIYSGDIGYKDDMGVIFIKDRKKDMIITGGENVYSVEVESAISNHPDVAMVAVIGIPHEKWGEAVHAVIQPVQGKEPTLEDIDAFLKGKLAGYKCPRSVSLIEQIPLSPVNKVLKHQLRQPFWA